MVFKISSRLQLPEQGISVVDEGLKGVGVLAVARHDRLRLGLERRRGQSGNVAVLLGLEGAQQEVLKHDSIEHNWFDFRLAFHFPILSQL